MCFAVISIAIFSEAGASPHQLAAAIHKEMLRPVIIEWVGGDLVSAPSRRDKEPREDWVRRVAKLNDREAVIDDEWVVLRSIWLPVQLRQYDLLAAWSLEQKRADASDFVRNGDQIRFVHSVGSSSPSEVSGSAWLKWKTIDPPFRHYRFVAYAPSTGKNQLSEAIAACFGADRAKSGEQLLIDPKELRKRRKRHADEHVARVSARDTRPVIASQLESIALQQMSDSVISSLYKSIESDHLITVEVGTAGYAGVMKLWEHLSNLERRAGREPESVRKNSLVQIWATGKGTFGGRLERLDGYGIYF